MSVPLKLLELRDRESGGLGDLVDRQTLSKEIKRDRY
jgi:hypothetical protein